MVHRPTQSRLADLRRTGAWSFLTWCLLQGVVRPHVDLLLAKTPGDLYGEWGRIYPGDVERVVEVAGRFQWSDNRTSDVSIGGLAVTCLWVDKTLDQLTDADFDAFTAAVDSAPSVRANCRGHHHARAFSIEIATIA